jgi:transcriptional regulator with XRE-family HTH domain
MKDRILQFLKSENKSSAQFAEEIGVQASGISHILSGRNNPSLDFVLKMLQKYNHISVDWLLFGRGSMFKEKTVATLFDEIEESNMEAHPVLKKDDSSEINKVTDHTDEELKKQNAFDPVRKRTSGLYRIVWFFNDNSFEEYFPHQG